MSTKKKIRQPIAGIAEVLTQFSEARQWVGASCAESGLDHDLWFPHATGDDTMAIAICHRCPLQDPCYNWARSTGQQVGVWGGVNFDPAHRAPAQSMLETV